MTDRFEARLSRLLLVEAEDVIRPIDAGAMAAAAMGEVPMRRGMPMVGTRAARALVLAGLLTLGLLATIALLAGSQRGPRPFAGVLDPTGPMTDGMLQPATLARPDGTVLVAGATADMRLHMESFDAATGRFTVLPGLDDRRFSHGRDELGLVPLADGTVLVVMASASSQSGATEGGYALRYDLATREVRETAGTFAQTDPRRLVGEFRFASWPWSRRADGTIAWTPPTWIMSDVPVYDPRLNAFSVEPGPASPFTSIPPEADPFATDLYLGPSAIVHLRDGRLLLLGASRDSNAPAAMVDGATFAGHPLDWPLVRGGTYAGVVLPDGRVLIAGPTSHVFDPSTDKLVDLDVVDALSPAVQLRDGRVLLVGEAPTSLGSPARYRLWQFDPATTTLERVGRGDAPAPTSGWTELSDGQVLVVSGYAGTGDALPRDAWILR
ncbi:MAG TPA: hypothetical protein VIZ22_11320 [Candidatus Limnocylindrales bacterium]